MICDIRGRYTNQEAGQSQGIFFYGVKGYLVMGPNVDSIPQLFLGGSKQPDPDFAKSVAADRRINMDVEHFQSFFNAIRAGKRDLLTDEITETYLSTAYCLLGNISYRVGRELTFDAQKQKFAGTATPMRCSRANTASRSPCPPKFETRRARVNAGACGQSRRFPL